jgi:asparagine synthase (glutamine-hydrolysing)
MFALAWYDRNDRKLLLARDPVGIKPLYYLLTPRTLVFGSQYDQLLAHPGSRECEISQPGLALYLRLGYIPAPYGILNKTHMLEPGTWLEAAGDEGVTRGQFYSFPIFPKPDFRGEAAFEAVDETVAAAVKRQMVSDVPLGCFLSGGIDSPLVAAKMATAGEGVVHAFTIGLSGDPADESTDASLYARELKVQHVLRHFQAEEALNMLDDVISACSEPFADYSIFPTMMVSRLAREQVKVMLSGDGGDELFWGYPNRFGSVLAVADQFRKSHAVRQGQRVLRRLSGRRNPGQHLVQPTIGDWYRTKHSHRLPEWQLAAVFEDVPSLPLDFKLFNYGGHDLDETAQWLRWNEFVGHLTMVLLKVDRASMHHSLEVRVPLLDMDVVELATRVDWRSCLDLQTGIGKRPLRESLARHVRHQTMRKRGFGVPMAQWLRGSLRQRLEDTLLGPSHLLGLPLKRAGIERLISEHMAGKSDWSSGLWSLFSLALWEERHFRGRSR